MCLCVWRGETSIRAAFRGGDGGNCRATTMLSIKLVQQLQVDNCTRLKHVTEQNRIRH